MFIQPEKLVISASDSKVTKNVKYLYNIFTEQEFMNKFYCTKMTYAKRVAKYGDPYIKAPLAKIGKLLEKIIH